MSSLHGGHPQRPAAVTGAIGTGRVLAEMAIRAGDARDQVVAVGDAIADLLLYLADAHGVAAAQKASEHGQLHFHGGLDRSRTRLGSRRSLTCREDPGRSRC
ncbi:hypothetical protein [Rhodococcus sp. p52]|uniref:hypothetical protein n=1 Tax=Rhodococcus sp. p52 TaxID=935199 RepID=UPI000B2D4305|nr:hypothetical protein [Rhodococcus sp. p52]